VSREKRGGYRSGGEYGGDLGGTRCVRGGREVLERK